MSPRKRKSSKTETADYRHDATRKIIPPTGLTAQGKAKFLRPVISTIRTCPLY